MAKLYRLKIAPNHRFPSLPIRLRGGKKKQVGKDKSVVLKAAELAEGEEFTLLRYRAEGRMIVEELDDEWQPPEATDAAVEIANREGIDLSEVIGTGDGGRILARDVKAALE